MLFLLCLCVLAHAHAQNELQVNTSQGVVIGAKANDGDYFEFYGLHYGGSTSGENRFKAPTPAPVYPGPYTAINNNVICAHPGERGLIGVEDCLTLNVFTNGSTPAKPVFVYLTGEEYTTTDTTLRSFRHLVQEGIVVVQINYRLSVFGFLCLGVHDAPGNAGLRDIVQALIWIQLNIAGFGGEPSNVSLFGHGSGAAMVDLITMSPLGFGLIHKAIAQSGSALAPWAVAYDPVGAAQTLGAKLSYTDKSNEELAKKLAGTDLSVLASALSEFGVSLNNTPLFAPCIENANLNPNDTFLADAPINILRSGNYAHIPYIAGYSNKEGTIRAAEAAFSDWLTKMQVNFTQFLTVDLNLTSNKTVERAIREYYFGQKNTINMENIEDFLDYHGDTMFLVPSIRGARERALTSSVPVRLYEFAYKGSAESDWAFQTIPVSGARHGSVLKYLLDYDLRQSDQEARKAILERYVAFLRTGIPQPEVQRTTWNPIAGGSTDYLFITGGDGPAVNTSIFQESARTQPHEQRMAFWNDIYSKYYRAPNPVSSAGKLFSVALVVLFGQLFVRLF